VLALWPKAHRQLPAGPPLPWTRLSANPPQAKALSARLRVTIRHCPTVPLRREHPSCSRDGPCARRDDPNHRQVERCTHPKTVQGMRVLLIDAYPHGCGLHMRSCLCPSPHCCARAQTRGVTAPGLLSPRPCGAPSPTPPSWETVDRAAAAFQQYTRHRRCPRPLGGGACPAGQPPAASSSQSPSTR
jgi:hypothetical protein